jgi:hypothetical protein
MTVAKVVAMGRMILTYRRTFRANETLRQTSRLNNAIQRLSHWEKESLRVSERSVRQTLESFAVKEPCEAHMEVAPGFPP